MQQYYFLFALGILWTIFATIQDIKTREVSNWLNFSLIAFALAYRAYYSYFAKEINFFLIGLAGFAFFFVLAYAFYYTKVFAGGDAKLLMGYGAILPFSNFKTLIPAALFFIFVLFIFGAIYSLAYSFFLVKKNKNQFRKAFSHIIKNNKIFIFIVTIIAILAIIASIFNSKFLIIVLFSIIPFIYFYTKALDKCMIKLTHYNKLTEGDWLEKDVYINKKITIKKSIHGLSLEDIKMLKKYKKSVLIKEGIPFTPSFLLTILFMVFFFSTSMALPFQNYFLQLFGFQ